MGDGPYRKPTNIGRPQLTSGLPVLPQAGTPCLPPASLSLSHFFLPPPPPRARPPSLSSPRHCPGLSQTDLTVVASFSLLPTCLRPVIALSSALSEKRCQKRPFCAVRLPGLSRKILFPAISLAAVRKVSPAERRHFSELHPSLGCLRGGCVW